MNEIKAKYFIEITWICSFPPDIDIWEPKAQCVPVLSLFPFLGMLKQSKTIKRRTDLNQIQWIWISYNTIYKRNLVLILVWLTIGSPFFISCSACLAKINKFIRISDSPCFFPVDLCFKSFPLRSSAPKIRILFFGLLTNLLFVKWIILNEKQNRLMKF